MQLNKLFKSKKIDSILIYHKTTKEKYFNYFTGFEKKISGPAFVLVKPNSMNVYCSRLEYEAVKKNIKNNAKVIEFKSWKDAAKKIGKKTNVCGLNYETISKKIIDKIIKDMELKTKDVSEELKKMREIKSEDEIYKIRKATKLAEQIIESVGNEIKKGMSEEEVEKMLKVECTEKNALPSFEPIVAFGKNAAVPHHLAGKDKLKNNQFVLIDFGVEKNNYCSDLTRMLYKGKPKKKEIDLFESVLNARENAMKEFVPGNKGSNAFDAAEKILNRTGFKQVHALGHGIGLSVHDYPNGISSNSNWKFEKNQVFALEPAIYKKGKFGIRVEENLVVGKNKSKYISKKQEELFLC